MSYIALARKWRPRTFSQLVGQEHVKKALTHSLQQQRVHHAYLFTGTRGVGKTSVARLLAKSLNCTQGIDADPCLTCDACLAIEQGRFLDLIEVDGASRTRVEDTRELLDNIQYAPTHGRFKIYLIDEVHMLSQHSFNALLKTLEEPPEHVKFLLATTDPQKLPITVLSRCLQFHLKPLSSKHITQQLQHILHAEQVTYDEQALTAIATAADGSMRDALSLLDQVIACSENKLTTQIVHDLLGLTTQDYALHLLHHLSDLNVEGMIRVSRQIATEGGNFSYVLEALLRYFHQMSVAQQLPGENPHLSLSEELTALCTQFTAEDIQLFYQIGLKGLEDILLAPTLAIGFEMTLLRMYAFKPAPQDPLPEMAFQPGQSERQPPADSNHPEQPEPAVPQIDDTQPSSIMSDGDITSKESTAPKHLTDDSLLQTAKAPTQTPNIVLEPSTTPKPPVAPHASESWQTILSRLNLSGLTLSAAEQTELLKKENNQVFLRVAKSHESLLTKTVVNRLEKALSHYFNASTRLHVTVEDTISTSPAQQKQLRHEQNQKEAEDALDNDPFFQRLKNEFSGELVKNSIELLKDGL